MMLDFQGIALGAELTEWPVFLSRYRLFGDLPTSGQLELMRPWEKAPFWWRSRRFAEAQAYCMTELAKPELGDLYRFDLLRLQCDVLQRLGRHDEAEQAARDLLALAEEMRKIAEVDPSERDGRLAAALSRLGRHDEAVAAGRRFVSAMHIPEQQLRRWNRETKLAEIYAVANRRKECLDLVAELLRVPSGLTVPVLRVDPVWDNVREDPRFQALLKDPKNDAAF
jgi:hypothetical protein